MIFADILIKMPNTIRWVVLAKYPPKQVEPPKVEGNYKRPKSKIAVWGIGAVLRG